MKKSLKMISVVASVFMFATIQLMAETSGLRSGTAYTIEDDVYDLMDVNTWQRLEFDKFFGFTSINSNSSGNFAIATHVQKSNVLGFAWNGNLWNDDTSGTSSYNNFTGFYGFNNMAIRATFSEQTSETTGNNNGFAYDSYKRFGGNALFGVNPTDKINFNIGAGYYYKDYDGVADNTSASESEFDVYGTFYYIFKNDEKLISKAFVNAEGSFETTSIDYGDTDSDVKVNEFDLTPGFKLQYKPIKTFTYGFYASIPFVFYGGDDHDNDTEIRFNIRNGFSAAIKPEKILFNAGISTWLPTIYVPEDEDPSCGSFSNSFYAGFAFNITPAFRLDTYAYIAPADGESFDEIWKTNFHLSLRAKL